MNDDLHTAAIDRRALAALAAVLAAAATLLLILESGLTYYQDTWAFLMGRQDNSAAAFLEPHNEHIVLVPVALEKVMVGIFGMTTAMPENVALTVALLATAVLLFVYLRRRVGDWPAVGAAALILFLGPAWQVLIWGFEIALVGSTAAGIAVLVALDRDDEVGDAWAALMVIVSIAFSSLGLSFALAAFIDVVLKHHRRDWGRLWVPVAPLALYAAWYIGYGHNAENFFSARNVVHSPVFVVEGVSATLEALSGLTGIFGQVGTGRPYIGFVLLLALLFAGYRWRDRMRLSTPVWAVLGAGASFWVLAAFNRSSGREATANRYMQIGAVFLLLFLANLLAGTRWSRHALAAGAAFVVFSVGFNLVPLFEGHNALERETRTTRADLAAMDIAEATLPPNFFLNPEFAGTPSLIDVNGPQYLEAKRDHGTPAYSLPELLGARESSRSSADAVLAAALPIATAHGPTGYGPGCPETAGDSGPGVPLRPGTTTTVEVPPGPRAVLRLRRFATRHFAARLASVPGGGVATIVIPEDRAGNRPWFLRSEGRPVEVCPEPGS